MVAGGRARKVAVSRTSRYGPGVVGAQGFNEIVGRQVVVVAQGEHDPLAV